MSKSKKKAAIQQMIEAILNKNDESAATYFHTFVQMKSQDVILGEEAEEEKDEDEKEDDKEDEKEEDLKEGWYAVLTPTYGFNVFASSPADARKQALARTKDIESVKPDKHMDDLAKQIRKELHELVAKSPITKEFESIRKGYLRKIENASDKDLFGKNSLYFRIKSDLKISDKEIEHALSEFNKKKDVQESVEPPKEVKTVIAKKSKSGTASDVKSNNTSKSKKETATKDYEPKDPGKEVNASTEWKDGSKKK